MRSGSNSCTLNEVLPSISRVLLVSSPEGGGLVGAGGRGGLAGEGDLVEGGGGQLERIAADHRAARIGDLHFERQAGERRISSRPCA